MSRPWSAAELTARLWHPARAVLPRTVDRFTRVHEVAVLSTRQRGASLVYLFRSADGTSTLWRGFAPATAMPPLAARFPIELSTLYSEPARNGLWSLVRRASDAAETGHKLVMSSLGVVSIVVLTLLILTGQLSGTALLKP